MGQDEGNENTIQADEQQILFVPLSYAVTNWLRLLFLWIISLTVVGFIALLIPIPAIAKFVIAFIMAIHLFILPIIAYSSKSRQQKNLLRAKSNSIDSVGKTYHGSLELTQLFARTFSASKGRLVKEQLPTVKAIVDSSLHDEIQSIELRNELLEQELIQSSIPIKELNTLFMISMMSFCLINGITNQDWIMAICGFFVLLGLLPYISFLRERLPFLRNDDKSLLVGPGWVDFQKRKRKWTVADSIMLLRLKTSKPLGTLHVRLLGPHRDYEFTFQSVHDPEFIRLWQRWMHPNPRLELMEQDT